VIAGIVVGCIAGVALVVSAAIFTTKKNQPNDSSQDDPLLGAAKH
jgi:hypothetical protein